MRLPATRLSRLVRSAVFGAGLSLACVVQAGAQGQSTPIQSPQDAACRNEARAKVFTTPDPQGVGLYAIGRGIYMACMDRTKRGPSRKPRKRAAQR